MGVIYRVNLKVGLNPGWQPWYFVAQSLAEAVKKAERKLRSRKSYRTWTITSADEVGKLEE